MDVAKSERVNEDRACRFRRIAGTGFRLAMEVTRGCNLSCKHCFVQPDQNHPTTNELTDIIRQAKHLNCKKLIITGGEPLLRRDLEQIISAATAQGILVDLNSNCFNLTRARVDALKAAGLQETSVSLYGGRSIHDELTGRNGAFDHALRGIIFFREAGITVDVHGAIWNSMLPYIRDLVDTVQKHDVSSITFFSMIPAETRRDMDENILFPGLALKTIAQARACSSIPVRTVGLRQLDKDECAMGIGIYGLGADLRLRPCLLSRHRSNEEGIDLHIHSLQAAMSLLESRIKQGDWCAGCSPRTEGNPDE